MWILRACLDSQITSFVNDLSSFLFNHVAVPLPLQPSRLSTEAQGWHRVLIASVVFTQGEVVIRKWDITINNYRTLVWMIRNLNPKIKKDRQGWLIVLDGKQQTAFSLHLDLLDLQEHTFLSLLMTVFFLRGHAHKSCSCSEYFFHKIHTRTATCTSLQWILELNKFLK